MDVGIEQVDVFLLLRTNRAVLKSHSKEIPFVILGRLNPIEDLNVTGRHLPVVSEESSGLCSQRITAMLRVSETASDSKRDSNDSTLAIAI